MLFPFTNVVARFILLGLLVFLIVLFIYLMKDLPSPTRLTHSDNYAVSTQIFDRNGELLYEIYGDENRIPVNIDDLPPYVSQASIAIEDQHFYSHFGFDVVGITRAAIKTIRGERLEGGSTITQQLVKNALLTNERSIRRKIKEAFLAILTEIMYTKKEILEMYLNYISYGGTAVGIESAANTYFGKHAKDLSLAEAALLAGLPQAPSRYSPFNSDQTQAKARQSEVLRRMTEDGYITQEEADSARTETLQYAISKTDIKAPHFVFFVRDQLYQTYGEETVEKGGLRVYTTLDLSVQNMAQASLSAEVANLASSRVGNGAAMVVKPNTGEILAMVGSKDYFNAEEDGQVNVTLAQRQPGSSIKPLMYATAFQNKILNPGSILLDTKTCFDVAGQPPYCPKNYDGTFKGAVTVREALGNSLNIPAVKGLQLIGLPTFMSQATQMGITSWTDPSRYGLSLTLGGGEVRMYDMVQAFSTLANEGVKMPLTPFLRVEDYTGKVLLTVDPEERKEELRWLSANYEETEKGEARRVMDRAPAYLVSHIMQDNNARRRAFGTRSELIIPNQIVSVKTGTTNDLKDNWTVGFTPEFLVMTWVGNNDSTPMNRNVVSGVTGAAPIFNDIMSTILNDVEPIWQEKPADVLSARVCANGMPPSADNACSVRAEELFWAESNPSEIKIITEDVWIDPATGQPPLPDQHVDGLVVQQKTFYSDSITPRYCVDCANQTTENQTP